MTANTEPQVLLAAWAEAYDSVRYLQFHKCDTKFGPGREREIMTTFWQACDALWYAQQATGKQPIPEEVKP